MYWNRIKVYAGKNSAILYYFMYFLLVVFDTFFKIQKYIVLQYIVVWYIKIIYIVVWYIKLLISNIRYINYYILNIGYINYNIYPTLYILIITYLILTISSHYISNVRYTQYHSIPLTPDHIIYIHFIHKVIHAFKTYTITIEKIYNSFLALYFKSH